MVGDDGEGNTGRRGHQHQQQQQRQQQQQEHQPRRYDSSKDGDDRPRSYDAYDADQPYTYSRGGHHSSPSGRGDKHLRNHGSMYDEAQDPLPHQGQYNAGRGESEGQYSAGSGDRDSSPPAYGMYPKMEEPGPYYQQPELHTSCLQVLKATQDTQGQAM
jgi:hypothetical protein